MIKRANRWALVISRDVHAVWLVMLGLSAWLAYRYIVT
jgi:hypothetical protein